MWSDTQSINRAAVIIAAIALIALSWCMLSWAGNKSYFAIRQVKVVSPLTEVDHGLLESAIRTELRGTFFSVAPNRVRVSLKKLPWVREVSIKRRWPMALEVGIEEYRAVGYWGENDLLSDRGEVFRAASKAPMPRFEGPVAAAPDVLKRYGEAKLALASHGLDIRAFAMSPRGAITVTTGNGVSLDFGREFFQERLNRFVALYSSWPPSYRSNLARIDLRYKAAVAVARAGSLTPLPLEIQKGQS